MSKYEMLSLPVLAMEWNKMHVRRVIPCLGIPLEYWQNIYGTGWIYFSCKLRIKDLKMLDFSPMILLL